MKKAIKKPYTEVFVMHSWCTQVGHMAVYVCAYEPVSICVCVFRGGGGVHMGYMGVRACVYVHGGGGGGIHPCTCAAWGR